MQRKETKLKATILKISFLWSLGPYEKINNTTAKKPNSPKAKKLKIFSLNKAPVDKNKRRKNTNW